ncbi:MAG: hypothetical protein WAT79_01645 [Saprospiraceae bacterium]
MIDSISFPDFGIALIVALFCAAFYAAFMYFKESKFPTPRYTKVFLAFLRSFAIAFIIIILFSPVIKSVKEEIKSPLVVMAKDVSTSMDNNIDQQNLEDKNWVGVKNELADKYHVRSLEFASQVTEQNLDSLQKKSTNFSQLFHHIDEQYADQNIGAIVISSDGIYNEGSNPLYMDAFINTPLYIVAQGDTTQYKDIVISNVFYNKIAYLGDKFSLQVDIKAFNAAGTTTKMIVESVGTSSSKKRIEENISINNKEFFSTKNVELEASVVGLTRYRISVLPSNDEKNKANNYKDIYVEVLDGRQKILLLANSPHPDITAIKQLILQNKNYEVTVAFAGDSNQNLSKYDLAILHNLPSEKYPIKSELQQLTTKKTPTIFFVGMQTSLNQFNLLQDLMSVTGNSKNSEEIQMDISPTFSAFTVSESLKNALKTYPPLVAPFGEYKLKNTSMVFSTQNIKKIKTNYPQLIMGESRGSRMAIFCGEGIWKWRLVDFVQTQGYDQVTELLNKSVQWTSIKEDKRKFRVTPGKSSYKENESIVIEGQLYNDNYELINEPDASLTVKNEDGKEYKYTFSKTGNSYVLNAGMFPSGSYTINGAVTLNSRLITAKSSFNIEVIDLEQQDNVAKHDVLRALVNKYGGKLLTPDQINTIPLLISADSHVKPTLYQSNITKSIIHIKWICFLILFLLALEWFVRRYMGSY